MKKKTALGFTLGLEFRQLQVKEDFEAVKVAERVSEKKAAILEKFIGNIFVSYADDDPFTICVIRNERTANIVAVGSSKRVTYAPMADKPDPVRGREVALSRAVRWMMKNYSEKTLATALKG